ncbi:hypothetical protein CEXT_333841 [Caerostris extrusa]|uniref:Uncharacterized protein n=1 Tax=Caerostris extrusa TaxID=172846 RepID=A0AAV4N557_CAEEX|nr:hypothetical protein CEXT_333841 [Caerostris extrusa]
MVDENVPLNAPDLDENVQLNAPNPIEDVPLDAPHVDENAPLNAPNPIEDVPLDAPHVDENAPLNAPNPDENAPLNAPNPIEDVPLMLLMLMRMQPLNAPNLKRKDQEKESAAKQIRLCTTLPVGKRKSEESRWERDFYEKLEKCPIAHSRSTEASKMPPVKVTGGIEPVPVPPPINQAGDGLEEDEAVGDMGELDEDDDEQDEQEINEEEEMMEYRRLKFSSPVQFVYFKTPCTTLKHTVLDSLREGGERDQYLNRLWQEGVKLVLLRHFERISIHLFNDFAQLTGDFFYFWEINKSLILYYLRDLERIGVIF